jgi:hypothetical protein
MNPENLDRLSELAHDFVEFLLFAMTAAIGAVFDSLALLLVLIGAILHIPGRALIWTGEQIILAAAWVAQNLGNPPSMIK